MAADTPRPSPSAAAPRRSRSRRVLRTTAWTFGGIVLAFLLLTAAAWWWVGSSQSLAFALTQAARYLPAGQSLETRDVSGSLRAGGHIGWLRWRSPTLAVEVHQAQIGWQLAPLWQRKLALGEVHVAQLALERRGPPQHKPVEPLEQLVLPIDVELPFRVDDLRFDGPPMLQATHLAGRYRYADAHHLLEVEGIDVAQGHYSARVKLLGPAPMILSAGLDGRVRAPIADDRDIDVLAHATADGTLGSAAARLHVAVDLKPADESAEAPMHARLQADVALWRPQPLQSADAELGNVDLARLWPQAPTTLLSGEFTLGPDAAAPDTPQGWHGHVKLRNGKPGPWDLGRLPLAQIKADLSFDGTHWNVPHATLQAGGGRIEASGRWSPAPAPWQALATLQDVRPGELHTQLAGAPVNGHLSAEQRGSALRFEVALQASGRAGAAHAPGALQGLGLERVIAQGQWQDQTLDLRVLRIDAGPAHVEGTLRVQVAEQAGNGKLQVTLPGGNAQLQGRIGRAQGGGEINARIDDAAALQRWVQRLPGLSNLFAGTTTEGAARFDASWQGGWQALQRRWQNVDTPAVRGVVEPTVQATLEIPKLDLTLPAPPNGPATRLTLRKLDAQLAGSLADATLVMRGEASMGTRTLTLDTRASGGLEHARQWRATLASLRLQAQDSASPGRWTLELDRAVTATVRASKSAPEGNVRLQVEASGGAATLRGPLPGTVSIDWQPLQLSRSGAASGSSYRLKSQGRLQGLPLGWAKILGTGAAFSDLGISGDLIFEGSWDIDAGDDLRAQARLARQSGDIRVQAGEAALVTRIRSHGTGTPSEITMDSPAGIRSGDIDPGTPAGLRQAELQLNAQGDTVRAELHWDSQRAGQVQAQASTRVLQHADGWQWADDAPLAGRVTARLPQLGVWSMLAPPGWRIAGTLDTDAELSGNRAAPRWSGTLGADQLALRAMVEGLDLRDGRLRATLAGSRVEITEFKLKGGAASKVRIAGQSGNVSTAASQAASDGGTLSARGELSWGATASAESGSGLRMALQGELQQLRVLVRSDRQLSLSGTLQARLEGGQFSVRGGLKADRAVIILPDETAPGLGRDVVVHSAAKDREAAQEAQRQAARASANAARAQTVKAPDIAVRFDLGSDFAVQGRGITTRLEGQLDIRGTALDAPPRITGEIKTVLGQYQAYGQQLDIATGIARFNGPFDNPALDIVAIRPNIVQRAGVQITGSAQSPRVRLYSQPALSDAETLSWLVLGRASATGGGESALLQQAALALVGGMGSGGSGGPAGSLASRFGLDEIGFKGPGNGGGLSASAVTLGKRLSQDVYVTYEHGLSGTFGTLYFFYDLTRRLTLRGHAGLQSGVDLIYTVQYE